MAEPHVISALRLERARLDGELLEVEKQAVRLRADLATIDRAGARLRRGRGERYKQTGASHDERPSLSGESSRSRTRRRKVG